VSLGSNILTGISHIKLTKPMTETLLPLPYSSQPNKHTGTSLKTRSRWQTFGLMLRLICALGIIGTINRVRRYALLCNRYEAYGKESGGDELFPEEHTAGYRRVR
jgi:hypothetical protein